MMAEPPNGPDLADLLSRAIEDYKTNWKLVDHELYGLCRRRGHREFNDVFPKVAIVARVYAAGLSRSWQGEGDPERETALALKGQADRIQDGLDSLEGRRFDRHAAGEIVKLHSDVTSAISHRSGDLLTSFVSKYLHFHSPRSIVPIFDGKADAAIRELADRNYRKRVREVRAELPDGVWAYRNFVGAFVVLHERVAEMKLNPSVKELDHLLWRLKDLRR